MSNIVWIASYPKSGNTWLRALIHNYLENGRGPADINDLDRHFADESKPCWYECYAGRPLAELSLSEICALRPRVQRDIASSRPGTVLVKTHGFMGAYKGQPLHDMAVTAGAVYLVRHPLDVVLSLADHFGLSVDDAVVFMNSEATGSPTDDHHVASVLTSWSNHVTSWTAPGNQRVLVVRYEDLLDKPVKAFGRIVQFLGFHRDTDRVKRAVSHSAFSELRRQENVSGFVERSPHSTRFFRTGRNLQWPGRLTDDQVARLVAAHGRTMRQFGYRSPGVPAP